MNEWRVDTEGPQRRVSGTRAAIGQDAKSLAALLAQMNPASMDRYDAGKMVPCEYPWRDLANARVVVGGRK